jgi:hypothetical protein
MPDNYKKFMKENYAKYIAAQNRGKLPWFIRDAYKDGDFSKGVNLK